MEWEFIGSSRTAISLATCKRLWRGVQGRGDRPKVILKVRGQTEVKVHNYDRPDQFCHASVVSGTLFNAQNSDVLQELR